MNVLLFDETSLREGLSRLNVRQRSAFALACTGRLINDVCQLQAKSASVQLLQQSHDLIWQAVLSDLQANTSALEGQLLDVMPDEDDNSSLEAAVVEDACAAMVYAMRSLHGNSAQNAAWSARRAYETADRFASRSLNEDQYTVASGAIILAHYAVQRELKRQNRDMSIMNDNGISDESVLIQLRSIMNNERVLEVGNE